MASGLPYTLKKLRAKEDLSQQAVADTLGFSRSTLGNYEHGTRTPDLATMSLFADFYGVTIDYLQGRSSNPSLNRKDETDVSKNVEGWSTMKLPNRMRELRRLNRFSQEDIAIKLGISTSAYGFYEQGKTIPNAKTLVFLADLYDVSVDYLFGGSNTTRLKTSNEIDVASEFRDIRNKLESEMLRITLDGEEISEEVKEFILDQLENTLIIAEIKVKGKFTPKNNK